MTLEEIQRKNRLREHCETYKDSIFVRVEGKTVAFKDLPFTQQEELIDKWFQEQRGKDEGSILY